MKDLREREVEARAVLAERIARLRAARRREFLVERRRAASAPGGRAEPVEAEAPLFWWQR
jgi:hypothetical protein